MHTSKIYTGIGSRETPHAVLNLMASIGRTLADHGWTLRSGHAPGADQAFEYGALTAKRPLVHAEIYLPWNGFEKAYDNGGPYIVMPYDAEAQRVAAGFHPNWGACSDGAKKLHIRNVYQVAGRDLSTASDMVICWTKDGKRGGGTDQALRIAEYLKIPIFDLAVVNKQSILDFVNHGVLPSEVYQQQVLGIWPEPA